MGEKLRWLNLCMAAGLWKFGAAQTLRRRISPTRIQKQCRIRLEVLPLSCDPKWIRFDRVVAVAQGRRGQWPNRDSMAIAQSERHAR